MKITFPPISSVVLLQNDQKKFDMIYKAFYNFEKKIDDRGGQVGDIWLTIAFGRERAITGKSTVERIYVPILGRDIFYDFYRSAPLILSTLRSFWTTFGYMGPTHTLCRAFFVVRRCLGTTQNWKYRHFRQKSKFDCISRLYTPQTSKKSLKNVKSTIESKILFEKKYPVI